MSSTPSLHLEKKRCWLTNRKVVDRYCKEARSLLAAQHQQPSDANSALALLDAALVLSPRNEATLELKARSLLFLRRFREVADMLQDYIPSFRAAADEEDTTTTTTTTSTSLSSGSSTSSSQQLARERVNLLHSNNRDASVGDDTRVSWCFSVSELKKKLLAGLCKSGDREGQWRYMVLGQACFHLGMMEDAVVLLQTARRLAAASCRRECSDLHEDAFPTSPSLDLLPTTATDGINNPSSTTSITAVATSPPTPPPTELENAASLLSHIKALLRRRAAALASLDAGLPAESIRHFSKILDGRRGTPHIFAAGCLIGRAAAYRAAGRVAEAIADCNRALAVDPASIPALRARADLLESVGSLPDCLRDLDHLKLLYDAVLWDRKLPGPAWRPHHGIRYRDIAGSLRALTVRIQDLRQRVGKGEGGGVDYYSLFGLKRGCSRSELESAQLVLSLKHRPDKAVAFVDKLELADEHRDLDAVRDEARMSTMVLYRLLQKGYSSIMLTIMDEEAAERQRAKEAAAAEEAAAKAAEAAKLAAVKSLPPAHEKPKVEEKTRVLAKPNLPERKAVLARTTSAERKAVATAAASVFQGVFCRDLAVVSSLLSHAHVGFSQPLPVKYEALSC